MAATPTTGTAGNSYATVEEADAYLADSMRAADAWALTAPDVKARALLTAFRIFQKQTWQGEPAQEGQVPHFPASGVSCKGEPVPEDVVPGQIIAGQIELAFELSQDAAQETSGGAGSNIQSLKAGSAAIQFFRPTGGANGAGSDARFTPVIQELVGCFLAGARASTRGGHTGRLRGESEFGECQVYGLYRGMN